MKKLLKIFLIVVASLVIIAKGLEWWLESSFESVINNNPDRAYNITYDDFDLHTFFKGITLDEVRIQPLKSDSGTTILGKVDYATINGFFWIDVLVNKNLHIDEIAFVNPIFEITIGPRKAKKSGENSIQNLFQDILTRGDLSNFRIENGSMVLIDRATEKTFGNVSNINVRALNLKTDSVQLKHIIPFKMDDLHVSIDSLEYQLPGDQLFLLSGMRYNLREKELLFNGLSLKYTKDWVRVSQQIKVQKDMIELELKELKIENLEPSSSFYSQLDINAEKVTINELQIAFRKNKNFDRPPDEYKPTFRGMINSIPIELNIDSILIQNSAITYSELGVNKSKSGSIDITDINASIAGVTNMPQQQQHVGKALMKMEALLVGQSRLTTMLSIPYDKDAFSMSVNTTAMDLVKLNPTTKPLAGVDIISGQLHKIDFQMEGSENRANNTLIFDYQNLDLKIISDKGEKKGRKKVVLTALANAAIHQDNMPQDEKYLTTSYQTERNIYRSPIVFIIKSLTEGVTYIAPGKGVQKFLHKKKKK